MIKKKSSLLTHNRGHTPTFTELEAENETWYYNYVFIGVQWPESENCFYFCSLTTNILIFIHRITSPKNKEWINNNKT